MILKIDEEKAGWSGGGKLYARMCDGRGQQEVSEGSMRDGVRKSNSGRCGIPNCSCDLRGSTLLNGTLPVKWRSGVDQEVYCPRLMGKLCL